MNHPFLGERTMQVKYIITSTRNYQGYNQIQAMRDIPMYGVKKGDLGGFIEGWHNLSQDGDCWVNQSATVCDRAFVCEDAYVSNKAMVCDKVVITDRASVLGEAVVVGNSIIRGNSMLTGRCTVVNSQLFSNTVVRGDSVLDGVSILWDGLVFNCDADVNNWIQGYCDEASGE
jgi:hypothetical protein